MTTMPGETRELEVMVEPLNKIFQIKYDEDWNVQSLYNKIIKKVKKEPGNNDFKLIEPMLTDYNEIKIPILT